LVGVAGDDGEDATLAEIVMDGEGEDAPGAIGAVEVGCGDDRDRFTRRSSDEGGDRGGDIGDRGSTG
jgi:hypothetical protein